MKDVFMTKRIAKRPTKTLTLVPRE